VLIYRLQTQNNVWNERRNAGSPGATPAATACCHVTTLFSEVPIAMVMWKDSFCREAFSFNHSDRKKSLINTRTYRITKTDLIQEGKTLQEEDGNSPPAALSLFLKTSMAILEAQAPLSGPPATTEP